MLAVGQVLSVFDCASIYRVPLLMEQQNISAIVNKQLGLEINPDLMKMNDDGEPIRLASWKDLAERYEKYTVPVKIVLVGKYTALGDAYASVNKALQHSCLLAGHRLELMVRAHRRNTHPSSVVCLRLFRYAI